MNHVLIHWTFFNIQRDDWAEGWKRVEGREIVWAYGPEGDWILGPSL